jgi:hypothetical protein
MRRTIDEAIAIERERERKVILLEVRECWMRFQVLSVLTPPSNSYRSLRTKIQTIQKFVPSHIPP